MQKHIYNKPLDHCSKFSLMLKIISPSFQHSVCELFVAHGFRRKIGKIQFIISAIQKKNVLPVGLTMGCVRSKEDKGPTSKYRPDNPNATPVNAHLGHYGPDPTLMGHSPAMKTHNSYNSHAASLTPFGGASSVMTPFGGASTSYTSVAVSSPFPSVITG